jgi:hypothetical protein
MLFRVFHNKRHPKEIGAREIRDFLAHLVNDCNVATSTQNQALHALLFLYREVLQIEFSPGAKRLAAEIILRLSSCHLAPLEEPPYHSTGIIVRDHRA